MSVFKKIIRCDRNVLEWTFLISIILFTLAIHFIILKSAFINLPKSDTEYLNTAEEHYNLGVNLYHTGRLENFGKYNTYRPPVYPIYVAGTLHIRDFLLNTLQLESFPPLSKIDGLFEMLENDQTAVVLANFPLAFVAGIILFMLIRTRFPLWVSNIIVVSFLLNAHMLAMINRFDYSLMEVVIILLLTLLVFNYRHTPSQIRRVGIGITLGIACLTRPVYLLFPLFIIVFEVLDKERLVSSVYHGIQIAIIAFLIMIPNIIRNYNVSHKFILVSEQGGVEVYHNSVVSLWSHPDYADYGNIWRDYGWPLLKESMDLTNYDSSIWYTNTSQVADIYNNASKQAIVSQPQVLITNIFYNIKQIAEYDLDYWGGKYFKHNEKHAEGYNAYKLFRSFFLISGSIAFLVTLLLPGKKELFKTLLFITALLVLSYSLVYYYPRYNYIKIPIYFISTAITLNWVWNLKKFQWIARPAVIISILAALYLSILPLYYFYIYL